MNMWAGSWLIASVVIERMKQMSSTTLPNCGNSSQISAPLLPNCLNFVLRSEADELAALELGDLLALGQALRHRLAVHLRQLRLVVERFQVRRAAGHRQPDDALRPGRMVERVDDAVRGRGGARLGIEERGERSQPGGGRPRKAHGTDGRDCAESWLSVQMVGMEVRLSSLTCGEGSAQAGKHDLRLSSG